MIVRESINFQRGKTDKEIRDLLFGWQEGQLLVNPHTDIVYAFIQEDENVKNLIICLGIGHIGRKKTSSNPHGKVYFSLYKKNEVNLNPTMKSKDKLRALDEDETNLVRSTITPGYIEKIRSVLGITIIFR